MRIGLRLVVGDALDVCHTKDLALWCNTGYGFPTSSSMAERAGRLVERGADFVLLQSAEFILTNALRGIKHAVPSTKGAPNGA